MKAQHMSVTASAYRTSFNPHNDPDRGVYFAETESPKD